MADTEHPILVGMNPEQRRAVEAIQGPLLILAGAGSGKTRVLTHRIAWMLYNGIPPWQILAVTFTNKAAAEMKERVEKLVGDTAHRILVSTFHSACVRFLRRDIEVLGYKSSFTIYDTDDQLRMIRELLKAMGVDPKVHAPQKFRAYIDSAKNQLQKPSGQLAAQGDMEERVFVAYERAIKEANAVDFNDLIGLMVRMFDEHPEVLAKYQERYRYLMVDEYQDTNHAQYRLIKALAGKYRNLAVVGDDDQSIYAFRGADIRNILSFEKDFPETATIRLERNYRSTKTILAAASAVVSNNMGRMAKTMWTEAASGEQLGVLIGSDEEREAELVVQHIRRMIHRGRRPQDFAIIYRSNAASRAFEQVLMAASVPHVLVGAQKFYERREVRDIISYMKLVLNPADDIAFQRVINEPPRGIGGKSLQEIIEEAGIRGVPLFDAARGWAMRGSGKARRSAGEFCQLIDSLSRAALELSPAELVREIISRSGYEDRLRDQKTEEAEGRLENLQELIAALERPDASGAEALPADASPVDRLQHFLDKLSLSSPTEDIPEADQGAVTLLTAHLAKGLEFPVVFVVGMYEGGFPHFRALDREEDIEEERRLVYVAFTRAREKLYVTRPRQRLMFNGGSASRQDAEPSRFLSEVPRELLEFSEAGGYERRMQQATAESRNSRAARLGFGTPEPPVRSPRAQARPMSTGLFPASRPAPAPAPSAPVRSSSGPAEALRTEVPEEPRQLPEGVRVVHPRFGAGVIEQRSGAPSNPKLLIRFDRYGIKSLLAQYASLEIVID